MDLALYDHICNLSMSLELKRIGITQFSCFAYNENRRIVSGEVYFGKDVIRTAWPAKYTSAFLASELGVMFGNETPAYKKELLSIQFGDIHGPEVIPNCNYIPYNEAEERACYLSKLINAGERTVTQVNSNIDKAIEKLKMDYDMKAAYDEMAKEESEIQKHNLSFIRALGKYAMRHFKNWVSEDVTITGKVEFVDAPGGDKQNEKYGMFKNIHVEQWTTSMEGDSYSGYMFAEVDGKWIKVPYSC